MSDKKSLISAFNGILSKNKESEANDIKLDVPIELVGSKKQKRRLIKIVNRMAKSEFGKKTLEDAAKAGYSLGLFKSISAFGVCNYDKKTINLNSLFSEKKLVSTLAHEARHACQLSNDSGNEPINLDNASVKSFIMVTRAMEADAQRAACVVSWELATNGDTDVYKSFANDNRNITNAFAYRFLATNDIDKASTAAFKAWYDDDAMKTAYEKAYVVKDLKKVKKEGKAGEMKFEDNFSGKQIVEELCFTENEKTYFTDNPEILEKGKFACIEQKTMDFLKKYMKDRQKKYGLEPDTSINKIPVLSSNKITYIYEKPFEKDAAIAKAILNKAQAR